MTLKNILGGGDFPVEKQYRILMNTVVYLRATNKLLTLWTPLNIPLIV